MKYGLSKKQLKEIISFIQQYPKVDEAVLFGSRAIDTFKEASDLDIALKGSEVTASLAAKLKFNIEEDTYLPFFFDFIAYPTITNKELKKHIRNKGKVIFRRGMGEWEECKLGDVAEIIGGGTPKTKLKKYWGGEIPWLTPRDLSNFSERYISCGERNISKSGLNNSSAKLLPKGTVLLSSRAPVGYLAISLNEITTNQGFKSLIPNSKTDSLFLFYLLKNNVDYLKSQATGTTFGELSGSTLKSLPFLFPPLPEQRAIASVLSSLDDKIDLLHRQNKTLEALAETLFRQWFVEEARDDWEEGTLGDLIELFYGKGLKSSERSGTGFPVVGSSGIVDFHSEYLVKGPGIVIGRKGTLGKTNYLEDNFYPIDTTYYVKSKQPNEGLYFEYFLLKNINFEEMNTDSAVPGLNRNIALSFDLTIPPDALVDSFNKFAKQIFEKKRINQSQIRTLEQLRDTLLPKLMSGEVRIKMSEL